MDLQNTPEIILEDRLVNYFGKWFDVYFQVRSLCGRYRIDLIMYHHSDRSRQYPIGIEIKKGDIKRGADIGKWCLQAKSYANALFDGRKATVFTAPQISGWYLEEGKFVSKHDVEEKGSHPEQNNVNSFLYKSFGIGEMQKYKTTWPTTKDQFRLVINTLRVWTSEEPFVLNTINLDKI
jgi:hypothetical protein